MCVHSGTRPELHLGDKVREDLGKITLNSEGRAILAEKKEPKSKKESQIILSCLYVLDRTSINCLNFMKIRSNQLRLKCRKVVFEKKKTALQRCDNCDISNKINFLDQPNSSYFVKYVQGYFPAKFEIELCKCNIT